MKRHLTALFAVAATALIGSAIAFANPTTQPTSAYPLTVDVVSGEPLGDHAIVETIDGREVHFANADNAAKFKAGGEAMQKKMDDLIVEKSKATYALKTCIVSDEELGDMGDVIMYVNRPTNQLVEFCCSGCVKKFKKAPGEYLPKLEAKAEKKG